MPKMRVTAAIVLLFLVAACAKNLPPTLDKRFVGKSATQRTQTLPNSYGLAMYSIGLAGLKNTLAVLYVASPVGTSGFPTCMTPTSKADGDQSVYTINQQTACPAIDNWNPPNITKTVNSSGNITGVTYNSTTVTTPPISLQLQATSGTGAGQGTHTLTITDENISFTTQTNNGALEPNLYTINYTGNIEYTIQYQQTSRNQTQTSTSIQHSAQVKIVGVLDQRDPNNQKIELQTFDVDGYTVLVNRQTRVTNSSLELSAAQTAPVALTNGVPVAQLSFNQTLNFSSSSSSSSTPSQVVVNSSATEAQIQSQGSASNIFFNSSTNLDRFQDLLNTVYVAVTKIQY